jgi:hypothetical protein
MEINELAAGALTAAVVSGTEHSEGRSADGRIPKMFGPDDPRRFSSASKNVLCPRPN